MLGLDGAAYYNTDETVPKNKEFKVMNLYILFIVTLMSILVCHLIAKKRGLRPVFWGAMGLAFGPLAIPFVCFAKPKIAING